MICNHLLSILQKGRPQNPFRGVIVAGVVCLFVAYGCGPEATTEPKTVSEFSVMTYNLHQYTLQDGDNDGQKNDLKPIEERNAIIATIVQENPDVLAIQEMGDESIFQEFVHALADAGVKYAYTEYLRRGRSNISMAVLSRFPITGRFPHTDDVYSIGDAKLPVARGFIDVEIKVTPDYSFRLLVAHLKAKVFHAMGQTEMRRNEARLLNKHVRKAVSGNSNLNLMVVGDLNDSYESRALREVLGKRSRVLFDLRPADEWGDVWTHYSGEGDSYERIDYILVNSAMFEDVDEEKTHAVRNQMIYVGSDHRPIVAVIRTGNATED